MTEAQRPSMDPAELIYDWNKVNRKGKLAPRGVRLFDETLRDGIQNPSVVAPKVDDKIQLVHLMNELGIQHVDIGLPGAGRRAAEDILRLAREIATNKLAIRPAVACRTVVSDIEPAVEISQKAGIALEIMTFIGSSPIRGYAEDWDLARIAKLSGDAIAFAVQHDLPCTYVTEDTTRSRPLARALRNHGGGVPRMVSLSRSRSVSMFSGWETFTGKMFLATTRAAADPPMAAT